MDERANEIESGELLGWLEFSCWSALVLAPILYYVNGPSVSTDQAVVRTCLFVIAAVGASLFRLANWRRRKTQSTSDDEGNTQPPLNS